MLRVSFYINECTVVRFLARSLTSYRRPPRWRSRCVSWPRYCWPRMCNFQNQTAGPRRWWDCGRPFSRWGLQRWALLHFSAIPPEKPINTCLPQTLFFLSLLCRRLRCWLSDFLTELRLKCFDALSASSVQRQHEVVVSWGRPFNSRLKNFHRCLRANLKNSTQPRLISATAFRAPQKHSHFWFACEHSSASFYSLLHHINLCYIAFGQ